MNENSFPPSFVARNADEQSPLRGENLKNLEKEFRVNCIS